MKRTLITTLIALFTAITALLFANTQGRPETPVVGYQNIAVSLPGRQNPVSVHIWYPAKAGSPVSRIGTTALFWGFDAALNAPPIDKSLPVILFSHGSGGKALRHTWITTQIANAGFIVVAPDHPGSTSGDSDPATTLNLQLRPHDLSALIDWLAVTPPAGLHPDLTRIGSVGFSMGGFSVLATSGLRASKQRFVDYCTTNAGKLDCGWYQQSGIDLTALDQTTFEAPSLDPRIRAVVAIDPALPQAFQPDSAKTITVPTLILNMGLPGTVLPAMDASALAQTIPTANHAYIPGASHFTFMDECRLMGRIIIGLASPDAICARSPQRRALHATIAPKITAFLTAQLHP
jgi:predicted dienelactone hydrolase